MTPIVDQAAAEVLGAFSRWGADFAPWPRVRLDRLADRILNELDMTRLRALAPFDSVRYARRVLAQNDAWEMSLLGWLPGQESPVHDHFDSVGLTILLDGALVERRYELKGGRAHERCAREVGVGASVVEELGTVHRVANQSNARAVSLHLYAPPLVCMRCHPLAETPTMTTR